MAMCMVIVGSWSVFGDNISFSKAVQVLQLCKDGKSSYSKFSREYHNENYMHNSQVTHYDSNKICLHVYHYIMCDLYTLKDQSSPQEQQFDAFPPMLNLQIEPTSENMPIHHTYAAQPRIELSIITLF